MDYKEITDFVHQLYGTEGFVPLSVPRFIGNEKKYLEECIDSTYVSSVGPFVDRFEEEMARYTGAARAVVCVNGTNALHMALMLVACSVLSLGGREVALLPLPDRLDDIVSRGALPLSCAGFVLLALALLLSLPRRLRAARRALARPR